MAEEASHIGPSAASESYLLADKIIAACKETGAEAVHPGYGFLSENAKFAEALAAEGVAFIGPPVGAIEAMGDKITSKNIAQEAGVSTVPGYMGLIEDGGFDLGEVLSQNLALLLAEHPRKPGEENAPDGIVWADDDEEEEKQNPFSVLSEMRERLQNGD